MFSGKSKKIWSRVDEHFEDVSECFVQCYELLAHYRDGASSEELEVIFAKLNTCEKEADNVREKLAFSFLDGYLLPQTRREILTIVALVDKIANKAQSLSRHIVIEHPDLPMEIRTAMVDAAAETVTQIELLADALELLFTNYDVLIKDSSLIKQIKDKESDVDRIEQEAIKALYQTPLTLAERSSAKHYLAFVTDISDHIEDIADEVLMMIVFRKV